MLDTILVLGALAILAAIGCLMGFFGGRAFRPFALLVGFGAGAASVMTVLSTFTDIEPTSTVAIIACAGVGLLLGFVSLMFRQAGLAITSLLSGIAIGWGLLFCIDYLLDGAVPQILYTFLSVLLAAIVAISCLSKPNIGRAFSTSILGGFFVIAAIGLLISWFSVQRGDLSRMLNLEYSAFGDFKVIAAAISLKSWSLYIVAGMLLGLAMFALQRPHIQPESVHPGMDDDEEDISELNPQSDKMDKKKKEPKQKQEKRNKKTRSKKQKKKKKISRYDDDDYYDGYDDEEYDDDYAELDAMISAAQSNGGKDAEPPAERRAAPESQEDVIERVRSKMTGDDNAEDDDDGFDQNEDVDEKAFDTGKITYTVDGDKQRAHGPLRPKNRPDENGFVEEAVVVDPDEVEAPTMVFAPITDRDEPEAEPMQHEAEEAMPEPDPQKPKRQPQQQRPKQPVLKQRHPVYEDDDEPKQEGTFSQEEYLPDKPNFKREKAISEEMDYRPQATFVSRTERNKKKKKKR